MRASGWRARTRRTRRPARPPGSRTPRAASSSRDLGRAPGAARSPAPGSAPPRPPRIRAVSVAKYVPPVSTSARAVGDRRAVGEQHAPGRRRRRRTRDRGLRRAPRRRRPASAAARRVRLWSRSIPRVGSSRHTTARRLGPPPSTTASASRCFSPPESSRGWRSRSPARPTRAQRRARSLVADASRARGSRGVLQQQRDPARARRPVPRVGSISRLRGAAASTCRRRCGPISATRSPGATRASRRGRITGPSRSSCQTRSRAASADPRLGRGFGGRSVARNPPRVGDAGAPSARRARAALTPAAGVQPEAGQQRARRASPVRAPQRPPSTGTPPAARRTRSGRGRSPSPGPRPTGSARAGARRARSRVAAPR